MRNFLFLLKKFRGDERGAFLVIFGILAIVLVATAGAVIDFTTIEQARTRAQDARDSTALGLQPTIYKTGVTAATIKATAQSLVEERLGGSYVSATIDTAEIDQDEGMLRLSASITVPMNFVSLVGINSMTARLVSQARSGTAANVEVALVLDLTLSMQGSRITALKAATKDLIDVIVRDAQPPAVPTYSKAALVPYAMGVNVGSYANSVRGPVVAPKAIDGATWVNGSSRTIAAINKANPARIETSVAHGFSTGDWVYISGISGGGFTTLNGKKFQITVDAGNNKRFTLNNTSSSSYNGSYTANSGTVRRCFDSSCAVQVTSTGHGFSNGDKVFVTGVSGMTQINNSATSSNNLVHTVKSRTTNTFLLEGTDGPSYGTYSSSTNDFIYCTKAGDGCRYHYFRSANNNWRLFEINNCATERTGIYALTDTAPSAGYVGRNYRYQGSNCIGAQIVPLSTNKATLKAAVDGFSVDGSTAGHIGLAWGWYMVSPNFGYLWPSDANRPAAYETEDLLKIVVLMTDGEFNTAYCNGVMSKDSESFSGTAYERENCNATNGGPVTQAKNLCQAMKGAGIIVYTVGFDIAGDTEQMMQECATSSAHAYLVSDEDGLKKAFTQIGGSISKLRLAE